MPIATTQPAQRYTGREARTSLSLRDMLFEEIAALRNGESDTSRAGAVAKLAAQIIASARLDFDYSRYGGEEALPLRTLQLGGGE